MKQQSVQVTCQYSGQEEVEDILLNTFRSFLDREVAEQRDYAA